MRIVDLTKYDPIAELVKAVASGTTDAVATQMMASSAKIANFFVAAGQVLQGAAGGSDNVSTQNVGDALLKSLVVSIQNDAKTGDGEIDLGDAKLLKTVIVDGAKEVNTHAEKVAKETGSTAAPKFDAAQFTDKIDKMADTVTAVLKTAADNITAAVSKGGDGLTLLSNMDKVSAFTQNDAGKSLSDVAKTLDTKNAAGLDAALKGQTDLFTGDKATKATEAKVVETKKAVNDVIASDKVISDKVISDKVASDKVISDKVASDKVISDKVASDKVISDKVASDKVISDKVASDKVISDKVASDKVISDKVNFGSDLYNFKFLQAGNLLEVFNVSGTILIATIPVQQDGTVLSFAGETFNATLSNPGVMQIGDVVIDSVNITAVTPPQLGVVFISGDTVNLGSTNLIIHSVLTPIDSNNLPIQAGMAVISSTGLATFNAADNDLSSKLTSVESALSKDGATVGGAAVFVDSDASYLFVSDSIAGVTNNDVLVKLQGVSLTGFNLPAPAPATTLTFDDLDSSNRDNNPIAMGYGGLDWGGTSQIGVVSKAFLVADNTYSDTSVTHSDAVAFNYWGNTTSVEAIGGGTFDFTSAAWCSAWGDKQNLSFEGWSGDTELYSSDTNPITSSATTIALNWKGIDKLVIDGGGSQWLMDNFIYQKSAVYVGSSISFDSSTLLSVNDVKLVDTTPPTPAILSPALAIGVKVIVAF